jgi:succinyl-CoA synthetase beta subunit
MATNDLIEQMGGKPASFIDLKGSAYHEQIETLIDLVNFDKKVKVIFINCFGGALNVDKVANSLIMLHNLGDKFDKPIVCRLHGEGEEESKKKLKSLLETSACRNLRIEDDYEKAV